MGCFLRGRLLGGAPLTPIQREELDLDVKHVDDPWNKYHRIDPRAKAEYVWQRRVDAFMKWASATVATGFLVIAGWLLIHWIAVWVR